MVITVSQQSQVKLTTVLRNLKTLCFIFYLIYDKQEPAHASELKNGEIDYWVAVQL